jgi:hypothetical protein
MSRVRFIGVVVALAITLHGQQLSADIIQNASFESPGLPPDQAFLAFSPGATIGSGWVLDSSSPSNALLLKSGALGGPTTNDGGQYLLFGAGPREWGILRQDMSLDAATPYRLTFQLSDQPPGGSVEAGVKLDMLFNGVSILGGQRTFSVPIGSGFQTKELLFNTEQPGSYRLQLVADGSSTSVDAFNLVAIPEPSTSMLLSLAGLALGTFLRVRIRENS